MADLVLDSLKQGFEEIIDQAKNGPYPVSDVGASAVNSIGMDGLVLYVLLQIEQRLESIEARLQSRVENSITDEPKQDL